MRVGSDIEETLHFLLEEEPADFFENSHGGLQAIWRLENRSNTMSRSKRLGDLHYILNPEPAKQVGDILGAIEK